jgi:hypothetical protein
MKAASKLELLIKLNQHNYTDYVKMTRSPAKSPSQKEQGAGL